ncbi:MAG: hypothetical protein RIB59_06075 [Rhodospirillales bacterium]
MGERSGPTIFETARKAAATVLTAGADKAVSEQFRERLAREMLFSQRLCMAGLDHPTT